MPIYVHISEILQKKIKKVRFTYQKAGVEVVNGRSCDKWAMAQLIGKKWNTYTMWVDPSEENKPVRYEMMGYDTLLGSHYDKYHVNYQSFEENSILDVSKFSVSSSKSY